MELDVVGPGVESQAGEGPQAPIQAAGMGPKENEIEVGDADVITPNVDLLHRRPSSSMAD